MAKKSASGKPVSDSERTDKDKAFDYWLAADGRPNFEKMQQTLPKRKLSKLRHWAWSFAHGGRDQGYPRSARQRVDEIVLVLRKIGADKEDIAWARAIADESVPLQRPSPKVPSSRHPPARHNVRKIRDVRSKRQAAKPKPSAATPKEELKAVDLAGPPGRVQVTTTRIIRDSKIVVRVKVLHDYRCQLKNCKHEILLPDNSSYVEAHHLRPLGQDHNGHDQIDNILCVCPHHHAALDMAIMTLTRSQIDEMPGHRIAKRFLNYHNQVVRKRWGNKLIK